MAARWLPVVGYEGLYDVSDEGQVRSYHKNQPHILALRSHPRTGHLHVTLAKDKVQTGTYVHRIVALAFIGGPTAPMVRHLDDNPKNNHLSNLAYGTAVDNAQDSLRNKRHHNANRTECRKGHAFTPENVRVSKSGGRNCITCNKDAVRRYQVRKFGRPLVPQPYRAK